VPTITLQTLIAAPPEVCFDLARDVEAHCLSLAETGERAVAGVTSGLLGPGDEVTWQARHFGLRWRLTVRITAFDRPRRFVDEQVRGPFGRMRHVHEFALAESGTLMTDRFDFTAPFGPLGRLVEWLLLSAHLRRILVQRADAIKALAEAAPGGPRPTRSAVTDE
jgi:ligand-binding SRPBCC domain-containing protein